MEDLAGVVEGVGGHDRLLVDVADGCRGAGGGRWIEPNRELGPGPRVRVAVRCRDCRGGSEVLYSGA